jgi:hypothetical protein
MVERFNRRIGEHLNRMPQNRAAHHRRFLDHTERDAYLNTFVADYNQTRLRCLNYQAPAQVLANLTGHNTCAGVVIKDGFGPSQAAANLARTPVSLRPSSPATISRSSRARAAPTTGAASASNFSARRRP